MSQRDDLDKLNQLGNKNTKYSYDYDPSLLEKIENKHQDNDYFIKFNCPEFTSRRQASRISLRFTFPIFLINTWWKANH